MVDQRIEAMRPEFACHQLVEARLAVQKPCLPDEITPIELMQLGDMAYGVTAQDSAHDRNITPEAASALRNACAAKLGAMTSREAVYHGVNEGLIPIADLSSLLFKPLSAIQVDILCLVALGLRVKDCATVLGLDTGSQVSWHLTKINNVLRVPCTEMSLMRRFEIKNGWTPKQVNRLPFL